MADPSPAAIEAARGAVARTFRAQSGSQFVTHEEIARTALVAALPIVRAELAEAIEAQVNPDIHGRRNQHDYGMQEAASIVRGQHNQPDA